jgi:hypothetical protein
MKTSPVALVVFTLSAILLLMVQFGAISPTGIIPVTTFQYTVLFWVSVVFFIFSTANLVTRVPRHAKWSTGYDGTITRTVKLDGEQKDYFIEGEGETPLKDVLLSNWPFHDLDSDSSWIIRDSQGNDITNNPLSSLSGTAIVVIKEDTE